MLSFSIQSEFGIQKQGRIPWFWFESPKQHRLDDLVVHQVDYHSNYYLELTKVQIIHWWTTKVG